MIGLGCMGDNLVHGRLAILAIMGLMMMTACSEGGTPTPMPTTPTMPTPPFEGMDIPKADVDVVIIGEVTDVTWVLESSLPDQPGFCYYDATVDVERTMFGPTAATVTIRQPLSSESTYGPPEFISSKRRLREGNRILAYLGRDSSLFDLNEGQFVSRDVFWIEGQEVVKYFITVSMSEGQCDQEPLRYERKTQPLEEVVAWLEEYTQAVLSAGN